jgi:polar amino acid transport system substrate-binding protein
VRKLALLAALGLALLAGCGGNDDNEAAAPTTTSARPCAPENLETVKPGQLTIGTDNPAFPPWFSGGNPNKTEWKLNDPATGKGFESAIAYAVANELGYTRDQVKWKVVPFNQSFKPGPKDFDFDVNQVSYTSKRDEVVDFSDSYYDVEQAVVVLKKSKYASATSLADLKSAKLGAQLGTTSYDAIKNVIQPDSDPKVYSTNNDAITALKNGNIDGIVVDYPTSLYVTAVQVPNAIAVGRLPAQGQEHFGLVFEEGNPLRDCANEAIAKIRSDGTLAELAQKWLEGSAPPVLQ